MRMASCSAGCFPLTAGFVRLFGGFAADELIEIAPRASGSFLLIKEHEAALVKLLEKLLPGNRFQTALSAIPWKIKAQDSNIVARSRTDNMRWSAATFFGPSPDFVMVPGHVRKIRHSFSLLCQTRFCHFF